MSGSHFQSFDQRLRKIDKRHRKLARGYVMSVNHDGLVIAEPRQHRRSFPWRGLLLLLIGLMAFKGFLHSQIGAEAYQLRVDTLTSGNLVEKVGGYAMTADPATLWISTQVSSFLP